MKLIIHLSYFNFSLLYRIKNLVHKMSCTIDYRIDYLIINGCADECLFHINMFIKLGEKSESS